MSLRKITAVFDCDVCGQEIHTDIDPAMSTALYPTFFEAAEDTLRMIWTSVQDGQHFCIKCTKEADEKVEV